MCTYQAYSILFYSIHRTDYQQLCFQTLAQKLPSIVFLNVCRGLYFLRAYPHFSQINQTESNEFLVDTWTLMKNVPILNLYRLKVINSGRSPRNAAGAANTMLQVSLLFPILNKWAINPLLINHRRDSCSLTGYNTLE